MGNFFFSKKKKEDKPATIKSKLPLVSIVAERAGISYDEAHTLMKAAKKKYGISFYAFAKRNLTSFTDEELQAHVEYQNMLNNKKLKRIASELEITVDEAKAQADRIKKEYGIAFRRYYFNRMYLLTEDEIRSKAATWDEERQKVEKIAMDYTGWDLKAVQRHMKKCDILYGIDTEHYWLFGCYKCNDEELSQLATIDISTKLSAKYNSSGRKILLDKVLFDEHFKEFTGRKHWSNRDTSFEEFEAFLSGLTTIFCKPTDSSCGRGADKIDIPADHKALYDELMSRERMVVEDCIMQHPKMNELYPGCVNTVRMISILKDDVCHKIFACVKVGNGGIVDNLISGGGMIVGVDVKTGEFITDGLDLKERVFETHPITGTKIKGFRVPNWDAVLDVVDKAIRVVPGINYVGWDVVVTPDGAKIIEGNSRPDLGLCQLSRVLTGERIKYIFEEYL